MSDPTQAIWSPSECRALADRLYAWNTEDGRAAAYVIGQLLERCAVRERDNAAQRVTVKRLAKAKEEIATLRARLAEAERSEETLRRCTICGFIIDTKWEAEFPAAPQPSGKGDE